MSEKRFKKMDTIIDPFPIWDTVEEKGYNCTDTLDLLVDLLNELSDENNILNKDEDDLKECTIENIKLKEENEQLRKELDTFKPVMFQDVRKGTVILYSKGDSDE